MEAKTLVGLSLILVGALLMTNVIGLTVTKGPGQETIATNYLYPDGTEESPLEVEPGTVIPLKVGVTFCALPSPPSWTVTVNVDGDIIDLDCVDYDTRLMYFPETHSKVLIGSGAWEGGWLVSGDPGIHALQWTVDATDSTGESKMTDRLTSYVTVPDLTPGPEEPRRADGYFIVDGQDTRNTLEITSTDPTLDVTFVPTANADTIQDVYVNLTRTLGIYLSDEFRLTEDSGRYYGTYECAEGGSYTLHGYVESADTADLKASVIVGVPWHEPDPLLGPEGYLTLDGVQVEDGSAIILDGSEFSLRFVPTANAENVERVYVEVQKVGGDPDIIEIPLSTDTACTVPESGIYELRGYVEWSEGTIDLVTATLGYDGGGDITPPEEVLGFGLNQIIGLGLMAFGGVMVISRRR